MLRRSFLAVGLFLAASGWALGTAVPAGKKVGLDLHVMSLCPFGVQAENAFFPAIQLLQPGVDFRLHFIAQRKDGVFASMHGQPEVDEDLRQVCAMKHFPGKFGDYVLERNKDVRRDDWREAARKAGMDDRKLEACAAGPEGAALLADNIKVSQERGIAASPTVELEGKRYTGARGARALAEALCGAMEEKTGAKPQACGRLDALPPDPPDQASAGRKNAAAPAAFDIQVVVDSRECPACAPTLVEPLRRQHAGAKIRVLEAGTREGEALLRGFGAEALPFYVIDKGVEKDPNFASLLAFYAKSGDRYIIPPGPGTYTPTLRRTRRRRARHLDVFLESLSPASAQAEAELAEALREAGGRDLTLSVHFVVQEGARLEPRAGAGASSSVRSASPGELASTAAGPLASARGEAEVKEDLRQICLFQRGHLPDFFAYLSCRNQQLEDPSRAAACLSMDEAVRQCVDGGEGETLLRQDARLARELGLASGPALLWENRFGPFPWNGADWRRWVAGKE